MQDKITKGGIVDKSAKSSWSCIVFAEQKFVCLALVGLLRAGESTFEFLKSTGLMGYGGNISALSLSVAVTFLLFGFRFLLDIYVIVPLEIKCL